MGRRKTTITTLNQRLMDDKQFKYSGQLAMNEWIWSDKDLAVSLDDKDLADYFIEYHQNSLPKKWDKLYRYAEKPNRYYYGLPTSTIVIDPDKQYHEATEAYLEQLHGNIDVIMSSTDEIDYYYTAWFKLVNDYGYDSETNELTVLSQQHGTPCYLKDGYLVLSQRSHDEFIEDGLENETLAFNYSQVPFLNRFPDIDREQTEAVIGTQDSFVVLYTYETEELPDVPLDVLVGGYIEPIKTIHENSITLDLAYLNPELQEGQDLVTSNESIFITYRKQDKYYWFSYELNSGLIPEIDNALSGNDILGQYYPRVYLKQASVETYNHPDTPRKKATLRATKILGLKAKDVTKSMADSIGAEYGNVQSIYLHMGVRLNTAYNNSILSEYCFRYFDRLLNHFPQTEANSIKQGAIKISDKVSIQEFAWESMVKEVHTGVISNGIRPLNPKEYCLKTVEHVTTGEKKLFRKRKRHVSHDHIFYHRVTEDTYVSITVVGLRNSNWVNGCGTTFTGTDEHLTLPIDRAVIFDLTKKEREYLYHHSLLVNLLHVRVTKKKWYQTGIFQAVLFVIGVVISVMTSGAASSGYMAIVKATAVAIAKGVLTTLAVQLAIKVAVKAGLNPSQVGVLALVITAVLSAYGGGGDFDFSKVLHAPNIMKALNTSFEFYQKMLAVHIADIQKQMQNFMVGYANKQAQLKEVQRLLDTKVVDMHQELLRSSYTPSVNLFETVEMFYSRHSNFNVIGVSHGLIADYVEGSLSQRKGLYIPRNEDVEDVLLIKS